MTLQEIKQAIEDGKKVFWSNLAYEVIKDRIGQYLIKCHINNSYVGLTHADGITLSEREDGFFAL
jgi:hypothetical protein